MSKASGFVVIAGAPNAGKSTLLNALAGSKVAAVTHKAHTTRVPGRVVLEHAGAQMVWVDTPGIFALRSKVSRLRLAGSEVRNADLILHIMDAGLWSKSYKALREQAQIIEYLAQEQSDCPVFLLLNKIDKVSKPSLLPMAEALSRQYCYAGLYMISGLYRDGLEELLSRVAELMPEGEWLYPDGAPLQNELLAAEITREKLLLRLHRELPYRLEVVPENWSKNKDGSLRIEQSIIVDEVRHRGIVIGAGGRTLAAIGTLARAELTDIFGCKTHLFLRVRAARN